MLLHELAALFEAVNDLVAIGQIAHGVSAGWMRLDRKNLAVHPEAANAVVGTKLKSGEQGVGICQTETAEFCQGVGSLHLADGCRRRRNELDGLVPKQTAEAEADHGLPQFMAVIDSCSTVAIDTQMKYGP